MRAITNETLMAFADGQLNPSEVSEVEAYIAANPEAAKLVDEFRNGRAMLEQVFGGIANEPAPQRLIDTIMTSPIAGEPAAGRRNIVDLAGKRGERKPWTTVVGFAMAASTAAVLATAATLAWQAAGRSGATTESAMIAELKPGWLVASGGLRETLEKATADGSREGDARVLATFPRKSGGFCREFETPSSGQRTTKGLACRGNDGSWRIEALSDQPAVRVVKGYAANSGNYKGVAGPNTQWDDLIEGFRGGEELTTAQESDLIKRDWQARR